MLQKTYPRVPYQQRAIQVGEKQIIAVVVLGSELRPHFAGPSFVRRGSESMEATQEQLGLLIAQRSSKVYRLSQHIGKPITLSIKCVQPNGYFSLNRDGAKLFDCNESWVTVHRTSLHPPIYVSYPLENVNLGFDHQYGRLELFTSENHPL